jgi:hypothetical protein
MLHNKIYIENLEIEDQILNQITGDLSFKLGGLEELKLSTNLIEPGITDSVSLGSVSKKFNNVHLNDIVLYNGANTTTISTESAGTTTLRLPVDNGADGQALSTNGSGLLSWGDNVPSTIPQIITDADLQLWENQTQITDTDPAQGDKFGFSVAISGNYAIVGAREKTINGITRAGAAYIYIRDGTNNWTQPKQLTANVPAQTDLFGSSVGIFGDYAVVGAWNKTANGITNSGTAYIYIRSGINDWTEQKQLTSSNAVQGDLFGYAVAISGDYVIVGAYRKTVSGSSYAGSAYIYNWNGTEWIEQKILTLSNTSNNDNFGFSVSISGDYAVVGARVRNANSVTSSGAAYIFNWNGTDWTQPIEIVASDAEQDDNFGYAVSISGDYVVVGARVKTVNGVTSSGSAYIYNWNGTNWTQQAILVTSNPEQNDQFGYAVAISGDYVIIGAIGRTVDSFTSSGAAYIYKRNGIEWEQLKQLTTNTPAQGDTFGQKVAINGVYIIVGSIGKTVNGFTNAGAAYINGGGLYIAGESATYIADTTQDFNFNLPTIDNLEYHLLNTTTHTANLTGSIVAGNITSAVSGSIVDAYSYNGTWLVK